MDAAYDSIEIRAHSILLHKPIVDVVKASSPPIGALTRGGQFSALNNSCANADPTMVPSKSHQLPCADVVASLGVLAPLRIDRVLQAAHGFDARGHRE